MCIDTGLSSAENRKFNTIDNRDYIVNQSLNTSKKYILVCALVPKGWTINGIRGTFNLDDIDETKHKKTIFYAEKWIEENRLDYAYLFLTP